MKALLILLGGLVALAAIVLGVMAIFGKARASYAVLALFAAMAIINWGRSM